jgi:protein gp37
MGDSTQISWCDATFNPWWGCEKVSPACAHCYAERDANRYGNRGLWGADHKIRFLSDANWRKPLAWAAKARDGLLPDGSENEDGHRPRVFTASMADVFEERRELLLPRQRLFELIAETPELDWLVLTKRAEEAYDFAAVEGLPGNVWLGVSVENEAYTWRVDVLREIPAAVRFLSVEPLLGSLFPDRPMTGMPGGATAQSAAKGDPCDVAAARTVPDGQGEPVEHEGPGRAHRAPLDLTGIHWVIVGGESGPRGKARPMHPAWVREVRDAVALADPRPAFHMKQWGSWTPDPNGLDAAAVWVKTDGTRVTDFQADVYDIDLNRAVRMRYAGPRPGDGGKYLDGVDHCEFPELALA